MDGPVQAADIKRIFSVIATTTGENSWKQLTYKPWPPEPVRLCVYNFCGPNVVAVDLGGFGYVEERMQERVVESDAECPKAKLGQSQP